MRKILETITLVGLGYLCALTAYVLYGPDPLPDRIPIHFDLAGHPDGYGPTTDLALAPFAAFVLYMIITVLARYASLTFHHEHETTAGRERLESLGLGMIAWIKAELMGIFVCIEMTSIQSSKHPDQAISLVGIWILAGAVLVSITGYIAAMLRAALTRSKPSHPDGVVAEL